MKNALSSFWACIQRASASRARRLLLLSGGLAVTLLCLVVLNDRGARPVQAQGLASGSEVHDPMLAAIQAAWKASDQAFQEVMKSQVVTTLVLLKNVYLDGHAYVTYVQQRSKHRHGLVGSYYETLTSQLQSQLQNDTAAVLYEATHRTAGATVVDDFMTASSNYAYQKTTDAAGVLLAQERAAINAGDVVFMNAPGKDIQRANNAVRNWQAAQNIMRRAQWGRNVALANAAARGVADSQARTQQLVNQLSEAEDEIAGGDLSDEDYEASVARMADIQARIAIEQYKMDSIRTTLEMSRFITDNAAETQALIQGNVLPIPVLPGNGR